MATKKIGIFDTGQKLFTTPKHVVGKITSLNIDNKDQANTIIINDQFSGDVSNGAATPTVQSGVLLQVTVTSGQTISVDKESLEDVKAFGHVYAYGSASGNCVVVTNYHFK